MNYVQCNVSRNVDCHHQKMAMRFSTIILKNDIIIITTGLKCNCINCHCKIMIIVYGKILFSVHND